MVKHIWLPYPYVLNNKYCDIFPLFLDYDTINKLPRGVAWKIDLTTLGSLCKTITNLKEIKEIIYIIKNDFCFDKGFFLTDFNLFTKDYKKYINLLRNFEQQYLYFEDSPLIDFEDLSARISKNIFLVEFM